MALSGDISKMYREVLLHPDDRSYHRFIWRSDSNLPWQDYQMNRVTFGVAASPFLAVKTLQQAAKDFASSLPGAEWHLEHSFYVDDFLGGAGSTEAALSLYNDLRSTLTKAGFQLKKWRSSSTEVLDSIPEDLLEPLPQQDLVDMHSASYPKALGVAWDSREDTIATHVSLPANFVSSKRGIISDIARTFDVLGWLSPAILPMKLLYKQLWELQLNWDDEVPGGLKKKHLKWREELPLLATVRLPRFYYSQRNPTRVELHGFCDASQDAYAAVVYVRATYSSSPPSSQLVTSKTRVAPLKQRTIPQLELCGAQLLAKLMDSTRHTLNITLEDCHAYSDSTIVLAWLGSSPQRYKIFIANRIVSTITLIPSTAWRHVPTLENPADCASRGLPAKELKHHNLWWHGPPWLLNSPFHPPPQPTAAKLTQLQETEAKSLVCHVISAHLVEYLETRFSSYNTLLRVMCWIKRLVALAQKKARMADQLLSRVEIQEAEAHSEEDPRREALAGNSACSPPKPLPAKSVLVPLQPFRDQKGLLRLGGRLQRSSLPEEQKHPIILSSTDLFTRSLFQHYHLQLGHCGPSVLLAHAGNIYHIMGAIRLARTVCSQCVICRKASAKAGSQLMGQLPPS